MKRWNKLLARPCVALALFAGLVLAGCASSPATVQHYMLPQAQSLPMGVAEAAPVLVLAPIQLSDLVDRRGLVLQTTDIEMQEALAHQWAESLSGQLRRRMRFHLAQGLPQWRLSTDRSSSPAAHYLLLQVEQFQGRFDGQAVVSGHWQWFDQNGRELRAKPFLLNEAMREDGYPELVYSLDRAWQRLAMQIAQELKVGNQ